MVQAIKISPQQQAWITRRANEARSGKPVSVNGNATTQTPAYDVVMQLAYGHHDGIPLIRCSFSYEYQGNPVSRDKLSSDQIALSSVNLVTMSQSSGSDIVLCGHDHVTANLTDANLTEIQATLAIMGKLDSVIRQAMEQAEDDSFPMAVQAVSWHLLASFIEIDGNRTKRGKAYPIAESAAETLIGLHGS